MKGKKGRAGKGKEISPVSLTRSHFVSNRQGDKYTSPSKIKKRKIEYIIQDTKDDNNIAPSKIKKRKIENILQDTKFQRKPSSRGKESCMCHQCQRNDNGRVVNCAMCRTKRFCIRCITKWYPLLSEEEVAEKCPVCRGYCNCMCCLRKKTYLPFRRAMCSADELKHAWHVIRYLYPWLREFHEHQNEEKKREAEIKGVDARDLLIPEAKYKNEQIYCYKCNAYIVDYHWSCRNCTCISCLSCWRELLQPDITTTSEALPCVGSDQWGPDSDDGICDIPLELKSVLSESFISKLYEEVSEIINNDPNFEESTGNISKCCCSTNSIGKVNLYCPMAKEVKGRDIGHFEFHWVKGEPVIVRNVLELTSGLSWDPMVMWRVLREKDNGGQGPKLSALAVDCRDWSEVEINIHCFFMGYQKGLYHRDGWPRLLRLKYCHNDSSFAEHSPRHLEEFMDVLPFPEYTDPWNGPLNLVSYLPFKLRRQIGPKIDIAYGVREELGEGDSVIKLHYDLHDVVNILMHTEEVHLCEQQHNAILRKHKAKKDEDQKMTTSNNYGGALWDIWRREDVPKLRDYLTKHARDFTNGYNLPSYLAGDLIHHGSVYLTMEHKRKLQDEYGIEAWTFEQNLGDAILVPAGCPYQLRNLKSCINVTLGFVSLESFRVCLGLADELRLQSRQKEDKLEVEKMAIYALQKASSCLTSEMLEVGRKKKKRMNRQQKGQ
ncbi:lysine-specific demethylase JMJ26-like isoform X2 [Carex rostrata]